MAKAGIFSAVALLLAPAGPSVPYDWSTADLSYAGGAKPYLATRAICAAVLHSEPPAADRPAKSEAARLKNCDSEALYFGIGVPADPARARRCAFVEADRDPYGGPSQPYEGKAMLAIIYANGRGATQNYDVAIHLACGLDNAAAEMDGRLKRLAALRQAHNPRPAFDTCLDTTSGALGGMCSAHQARLADQERARNVASLAAMWSPAQRQAYARLRKSAQQYAETLHDMDCFRGTAQAQCTIDGASRFMTDFTGRIMALARGSDRTVEAKAMASRGRNERSERHGLDDSISKDDRPFYDENAKAILANRARFERDLVAFARLTFPAIDSHRIRRMFSDL